MDKLQLFKNYFRGNRIVVPNFLTINPAAGNKKISQAAEPPPAEMVKEGVPTDDEGFVSKPFRALSETVVDTFWGPIDYSKGGVLKESISIIPPILSLFKDHRITVDAIVGHGKDWEYKESEISGIDALLRVDSNVDLILARNVYTGSANRCSVTNEAVVEKSHPDMKDSIFWDSMYTEVDGEMVRWIAIEVAAYFEISLVWFGADPHAMSLVKDKLDYYTAKLSKSQQFFLSGTDKEKEVNDMDKIIQLIKQKLGKDAASEDQVFSVLSSHFETFATQSTQINQIQEKVTELEPKATLADNVVTQLRKDVTIKHMLANGIEKEADIDELEKDVINAADYEKLVKMLKQKTKAAENRFPLKCANCGSTNVDRRSSVEITPGDPEQSGTEKEETITRNPYC